MAQISCSSSILKCTCALRQQSLGRHAAPMRPAFQRLSNLSTDRSGTLRVDASDPGDNGVPVLDDAEASPIPLVPQAPQSSPGPLLALGAVALGAAVFLATRLGSGGGVSFDALQSDAVPLSAALANHRPSVIEFYASWCEVCRELLPDTLDVERSYKDKVNFVALNVDNTKWAPEVAEYGVNGIPQYVFLDGSGKVQASAAGKVPRQVLEQNVAALAEGQPVPWSRVREVTTALDAWPIQHAPTAPRAHG